MRMLSKGSFLAVFQLLVLSLPVVAMDHRAHTNERVEAIWTRLLENMDAAIRQQFVGYCDIVPAGKMARDVVSESSAHVLSKANEMMACVRELQLRGGWIMPDDIGASICQKKKWRNFRRFTPLEIAALCGSIPLLDKLASRLPLQGGIGPACGSYFDFENACLQLGCLPDEAAEQHVGYDHPALLDADQRRPGALLHAAFHSNNFRMGRWLIMLGAKARNQQHGERLLEYAGQVGAEREKMIRQAMQHRGWFGAPVLPAVVSEWPGMGEQEQPKSQEWWQQHNAQIAWPSKPTDEEIQSFLDKQAAMQ